MSEIVHVDLGTRSYDIAVGSDNLSQLGRFVTGRTTLTHAVVITDRNVANPHAVAAVESLHATGARTDLLTVDAGEGSKSIAVADLLWNSLAQVNADRGTVIVAVGGGVVGDLAGFVAATYARGLRLVQVPTTLLAQVDSSVGGKVGVNLPTAKNLVGSFWQPLNVLIDTAVLNTLPDREYRSGLAEVVKYGVILDADFFRYLEQNIAGLLGRDKSVLNYVVAHCCRLKAAVVQRDEREESGLRAVLNYGHTFAHAFETVTSYGQLLHGEAVSMGMMCAARFAQAVGRTDGEIVARQLALLRSLGLPVDAPAVDPQAVLAAMGRDKKVSHGQLHFVLPTRMGHVELVGGIDATHALAALSP